MKNRNSQFFTFAVDSDSETFKLKGYAIRYEELSQVNEDSLGKWATKIKNGAFSDTVNKKVDVFLEHDHSKLLASTKNGSLSLTEDNQGIRFEFSLGDSSLQRDVFNLVQQGLYNAMSFGVEITESEWVTETHDGEEIDVRLLKAGNVFEISVVNNPAFETTNLMVASNDDLAREDFVKQKQSLFSDASDEEIRKRLAKYLDEVEAEKKAKKEAEEKAAEEAKLQAEEEARIKAEEQVKADLALAKSKLKLWEIES